LPELDPTQQRQFAVEVVQRLREAGFEAYWAGGCVRDRLLGRAPKDYDVATSARPPEIRALFGQRRTLAIGAAFGVITVLGAKAAGPIEVATFRQDIGYSDGRHPDKVAFSTAEEDAKRRDFTINGLFFDPLSDEVLDFVGGRADLERRLIRAIGDPFQRFAEDKLRLLRAIRFTAKFGFQLTDETRAAIRAMAAQVTTVSPERIAAELRQMLVHSERAAAVRLLDEVGLLAVLLAPGPDAGPPLIPTLDGPAGQRALAILARLQEPTFALALAALLGQFVTAEAAEALCRRWRLANRDTQRCAWLIAHQADLTGASRQPWPRVQRLLIHPGIEELLELQTAADTLGAQDLEFCRAWLSRPRAELDPPPLITGDDLLRHRLPPGKHFQWLLEAVRDAQLERKIASRGEALALVDALWLPGEGKAESPGA
jgi:tRNA nucleotidyltransferase/poly(A) polymerase